MEMVLSLGGGRGLNGLGDEIDDLIAGNTFDDTGPVTVTPFYGPTQATVAPSSTSSGDGFWSTLGKSLLGTGIATVATVTANQLGTKTPQQQAAIIAAQKAQEAAANRQMLMIGGIVVAVMVGGALLLRRRPAA